MIIESKRQEKSSHSPSDDKGTFVPRKKTASRRTKGNGEGKKLVIVESPAKARTINRYLGKDFLVKASMGHVRDLPRKGLGVDPENGFKPTYELINGRKKILAELKKYVRKAPEVYLATDLDREGEAIAWHLAEALKIPPERLRRVVFNEITKPAIERAFANPRGIDMNKVDAQQARRILDRLVGYEISPLLWRKVARGLSAGRVQSVAVRLIVEREREIRAFTPEEYWRIRAIFTPDIQSVETLQKRWQDFIKSYDPAEKPSRKEMLQFLAEHGCFEADLLKWNDEKFKPRDVESALAVAKALGMEVLEVRRSEKSNGKGRISEIVEVSGIVSQSPPPFIIESLKRRRSVQRPPAPFTTATLQQSAAVRLGFSASRTMRLAQRLYEGVEIPGIGSIALITYMRTDSTNISAQAIEQVRNFISEKFGGDYLPEKANVYRSSARAQQAHEAIRPTDVARTPQSLEGKIDADLLKLYDLIWRRFVACQMSPAQWDVSEVSIVAKTAAGEAMFKAIGRQLIFDGFLKVAGKVIHDEQILPPMQQGANVAPVAINPTQHFTQPPPRYTEASLVKALEAEGIGRPSTYATIIQTIQDRNYVKQINKQFHATELGMKVTDKLVKHFPDIFDLRFTARMEEKLDDIEEARTDWIKVLTEFYKPFKADLEQASKQMVHAKAETEPSDYTCPTCGKAMVYRWSNNGRYLACTGYPECKTTFPVDENGKKIEAKPVDIACPVCGEPMMMRQGRYGKFLRCSRYPECDGLVKLSKKGEVKLPSAPPLEVDIPCPKCGKNMYLRRSARGPWLACSQFPKCRGRLGFKKLDAKTREKLEKQLAQHEKTHPTQTIRKLDGSEVPPGYIPKIMEKEEDKSESD